jgi:LacI family transcriptional regulator
MNLKQLSKELNLSISTVSKALSDSQEISTTTKKKVQAKAKELNYHANPFASNLRNKKSKTIALIIPEIANNFFSLAINGAESFAQEKGYHVLIYQTNEDAQKEKSIAKYLLNGRVDGVMISLSNNTTDVKHLKELQQREIPLVFFDRASEKIDLPRVTTDDYDSAFMGTEHLIKNGIKDIAFLSISKSLSISNDRAQGYLDALKNNKITTDKKRIIFCDGNREANKNAIRKVLKQKNRPQALFSCVEELAILSYEVCEELKLRIPADIKIISYSNLKTASILNPSLTTITQPAYEIGREAASILFKLIDKECINANDENIVLKSTLIVRNSTKLK